jgi:hypothetical protein
MHSSSACSRYYCSMRTAVPVNDRQPRICRDPGDDTVIRVSIGTDSREEISGYHSDGLTTCQCHCSGGATASDGSWQDQHWLQVCKFGCIVRDAYHSAHEDRTRRSFACVRGDSHAGRSGPWLLASADWHGTDGDRFICGKNCTCHSVATVRTTVLPTAVRLACQKCVSIALARFALPAPASHWHSAEAVPGAAGSTGSVLLCK